ncbi:MAG: PASTA domain-containing protein [Thermotogae bacterium]|nr:PASTA domain-containing protein [Thermotogota bacterium]
MEKLLIALRFFLYMIVWGFVWYFVFDLILGFAMPLIQRRNATVTVPKVTNMPIEKAKAVLKDRGLKARVDTTVPSLNTPAGTVIGQEPPAGTRVKRGRNVYLTLSAGAKNKSVPDLVGMALEEAVRSLEDVGFTVKTEPLFTLDEEPGYVLRMYPPAGSSVPIGSTIILYYSAEPPDSLLFEEDSTQKTEEVQNIGE